MTGVEQLHYQRFIQAQLQVENMQGVLVDLFLKLKIKKFFTLETLVLIQK